jgi:hypothetical protein
VDAVGDAVDVIVMVTVVVFCAGLPSAALTLITFDPKLKKIVRLQLAVPDPTAVSLSARVPFTVTLATPLFPLPLSVAVPDNTIEGVPTICPSM